MDRPGGVGGDFGARVYWFRFLVAASVGRADNIETLVKEIPFKSRRAEFNLYFFGDVHWGSVHCDEAAADRTIGRINQDPNALVFLMGDLGDFIGTRDPRFEGGVIAEWVNPDNIVGSQISHIKERLRPIARKVVGIVDGNHEQSIQKHHSLRIKSMLVEEFGWADLGYSSIVHLVFRWGKHKGGKIRAGDIYCVNRLKIYLHHGWGGGRTMADANHFIPLMANYEADWFITGHTHKRYAGDMVLVYADNDGNLHERRRLWGRSGTFLKTFGGGNTSYAEMKGMNPLWRGALMVKYMPHSGEWIWAGD